VNNKGQLASSLRVSSAPGRHSTRWELWQLETAGDTGILRTTARKKWSGVANNGQDIQHDEGWEAVYDTGTTRKFSTDFQTATDAALAQEQSTLTGQGHKPNKMVQTGLKNTTQDGKDLRI
jgi:hypothetical protein